MKTTSLITAIGLVVSVSLSTATAQSLLIDFGSGNATIGASLTISDASNGPDSNGNYWNNYTSNGATLNNLVFTNNSSSGISLAGVGTTVGTANFGVANGTVSLANSALNVFTAYTDGIFRTTGNATLTFGGLNPSNSYSFDIFGSRSAADNRRASVAS